MKKLLRHAVALAALALALPALAQQANTRSDGGKIGLGVGLTSTVTVPGRNSGAPDTGYLFFVPINATPQLRIEPFIGWARSDTDATGVNNDTTIGVGGFFVHPVATQLQLYAGGRLGLRWVSTKDAAFGAVNTSKTERRDTLLALAAGGEYLPIPRVAIGAEFQLGYVSVGDTKETFWNGTSVSGGGGSGTATQATLFARIYLF
jgi:hypothetical protein